MCIASHRTGCNVVFASFTISRKETMPLTIKREIFDRVKTAITESGRINMISWAEIHGAVIAESVDEIRRLSLLDDCRTTACVGGLICYLATWGEISRAAEIYSLSGNDGQGRCILEAVFLIEVCADN